MQPVLIRFTLTTWEQASGSPGPDGAQACCPRSSQLYSLFGERHHGSETPVCSYTCKHTHTDSIRWLIFSSTHSEQCRCWTYVMTTGATLLVMMDLPLLLWMLSVWKEALLADRLLSVIPLPWKLSCSVGWGAALAVVPILHWQLSITETHTCITWCFILRTFCFVSLTWLN